jgi:hypothetical protein
MYCNGCAAGLNDFLGGLGLGMLADQLKDLDHALAALLQPSVVVLRLCCRVQRLLGRSGPGHACLAVNGSQTLRWQLIWTRVLNTHCVFAAGLNDFLGGLGLGMLADQLKDLDLGELMDTPPPGVDEAIAISKVGGCAAPILIQNAQCKHSTW